MKKYIFPIIVLLIISLSGCGKSEKSDFKIYVVSRDFLTQDLSDAEIISTAKKNGRLAFDGNDIEGYNWETHTLTFKDNSVKSLGAVTKESGGSAIFKVDDTYAFVFSLNDKLIYNGGFAQGSKNPDIPLQPYISDKDTTSVKILFNSKYASGDDCRLSNKLYSFLNDCGLLSAKTE